MDENVKILIEKNGDTRIITPANINIKPGWDWSGADLSGWHFSDVVLSEPDHPASFEAARLEKTIFYNVDLKNANFSHAKLNHADFTEAVLVQANFDGAKAKGAKFYKAYLRGASFKGAALQNSDFRAANLSDGDFTKAKMRYANLHRCRLEGACFKDANLRHTDFEFAYLKKANFQNADIKDASMDSAHLRDCNFENAYLKRTNLKRTFLGGANLNRANLSNATMKYAECDSRTTVKDINLFQCKLDYSTLKNCRKGLDQIVIQERKGNIPEAKEVYLNLKNYFRSEGLYEISGDYYYREKLMERKMMYSSHGFLNKFLWLKSLVYSGLCGYGEKPHRVILSSLLIIFIFGLIYWASNGLSSSTDYDIQWYDNFYFSVVTFTTLGFGDIHPGESLLIKFCTMLEAFFGAFMIALFVLTFGRRMLR